MLAVFLALLWWQSRYTWIIHNPMYGWPIPFNNVWYGGLRQWRPSILILDVAVWLILAGSVGHVLERWRRRPNRLQLTLGSLLLLQAVVAVLLSLGCGEGYLRAHPNNDSIFPKYARWEAGGVDIWFDIGLFTDPPHRWPFARITIVLAIGCTIYTIGYLLWGAMRLAGDVMGGRPHTHSHSAPEPTSSYAAPSTGPRADDRSPHHQKEPGIVRVVAWVLVAIIAFFLATTLFPPAVR